MQNDFVLRDKFTKKFELDIETLFTNGYNDLCHEVVYSSYVAKCDRRVFYTLSGVESSVNLRKKMHHSYMIKKWVEILSKGKLFNFLAKEFIVADQNYNVTSTIDIAGKVNDLKVIFMVREVTEEVFKNEKARRFDVVELMTQMWLSEVNDGFLVYESLVEKSSCVFHIVPNVSVLNAVKEKLLYLRNCKLTGTLPEQKYENSDADECQECRFREECWRDKRDG